MHIPLIHSIQFILCMEVSFNGYLFIILFALILNLLKKNHKNILMLNTLVFGGFFYLFVGFLLVGLGFLLLFFWFGWGVFFGGGGIHINCIH